MTTALIVVDVQNDFITGSLPVQDGAKVAHDIRELILDTDNGYDFVVTTQDWHKDPGEHFSDTPDYVDSWPVHCAAGEWGARLHDDIFSIPVDAKFFKGHFTAAYSGFQGVKTPVGDGTMGTKLVTWLTEHKVDHVDVVGLALDYCVKATAMDASAMGFQTRVLTSYTGSVSPEGQTKAIADMEARGVYVVGSTAPVGGTKRDELITLLKEVGGRYREEPVHLATGEDTHVYLDVKGVLDRGSRLNLAALALALHTEKLAGIDQVTAIGGPTMGADVLSHIVVSQNLNQRDWKWFSVRDQAKTTHGLGRWIEGAELGPDDYVIITDDVANSGKSLVEAVERVSLTRANIVAVMPLVDRSDQTRAKIEGDWGIPYLPLLTSADLDLAPLKAA